MVGEKQRCSEGNIGNGDSGIVKGSDWREMTGHIYIYIYIYIYLETPQQREVMQISAHSAGGNVRN